MEILYGLYPTYIDVTLKLDPNKDVTIPSNDMKRSLMFGVDPLPGIVKHIIIKQNNENIFKADTTVKLILNISKNEYKVIHKNTCLLVEPRKLYFLKNNARAFCVKNYSEQVISSAYMKLYKKIILGILHTRLI